MRWIFPGLLGLLLALTTAHQENCRADTEETTRKVVFVAGRQSHGYGAHEHYAGSRLLAESLQRNMPGYEVVVHRNGWPEEPDFLEGADALVIYSDGGGGHPIIPHLDQVQPHIDRGMGLACIHYAVEIPKGEPGDRFVQWLGGYFETHWSVNPHWVAKFETLPDHPITRGVEPFEIDDEWYYHMRFRDNMEGVTPILTAIPPESTLSRPDGPHSGNPHVRAKAGQPQHVAWATEREDGGRGFGFTGGHHHWNWGDPNFRRLVLNAIVWTAKGEVPEGGVSDQPLSISDLEENQDFRPPENFNREAIQRRLNLPSGEEQTRRGRRQRRSVRPTYQSDIVSRQTPGHAVKVDVDIRGATELHLVVNDAGDGFSCDWADWAEPRLVGPEGELRLTELPWTTARTDWGEVRINRNVEGGPLRIAGESVEYGIGTHANSVISYRLPPGYHRFLARAGLDNGGTDQGGGSTVQFQVYTQALPRLTAGRAGGSRDPELAVDSLDVAEGLEATLFASEPEIVSLTNLDIDHRGRVWVCEVKNYRRHAGTRPEGDRILILEDTTGDGIADKTKVFYQGPDVDSAMGICVLGNKVIVSASPNILIFTDENGDDRADRKEILFSQTGQPQHDHSAHSFVFGPDGYLYWNFGNTGQKVCDPDGNVIVDLAGNEVIDNGKPYFGGMPFRCRLDGSRFEVLGHNFRNNYEVAVDSFGTLWQSDNDDDGHRGVRINYVMEYGNYGYRDEMTGAGWQTPRTNMEPDVPSRHWYQNDPGVIPNLLQTGAGSPTGIAIYEGRLLPEVFWDQMIHCDAGPNIVRAYPVQRDGAGYEAEIVDLVHGARDNWFRPADVCVAPDGSVFITDWYDPGVGGHNMQDLDRGRLFRIAPPGHRYEVPEFDFDSVEGAVEALKNPNLSVRYLAYTALTQFGTDAEEALLKVYHEDDNPRIRARALWVLGEVVESLPHLVDAGLKNENPDLRIVALRLARRNDLDVVPLIAKLLPEEKDPQVLRECAIALRHNEDSQAPQIWAELAQRHDGKDRWYLEALGIAADRQWDRFFDQWLEQVGDQWNTPAGRDIVWRSRARQTPELLAQLISQGSSSAGPLPRYFRAFDFQSGEAKSEALRTLAFGDFGGEAEERELIITESLGRLNPNELQDAKLREALSSILKGLPRSEQFVSLVGKFGVSEFHDDLLELSQQQSAGSLGVEAIRILLAGEQQELIRGALQSEDLERSLATAEVLGSAADGRGTPLLLEVIRDETRDLELRRLATQAAGRTVNGARRLLSMAERETLPVALKDAAASTLNRSNSPEIREAAAKVFPLPPSKDDAPLPPVQDLVKMRGDPERGQKVFATHGECAKCHQVGREGKEVGPALTEIGAKLSREALFESILFPSAGISHNYETYAVELEDGNLVTGILVSRTNDEVVIKNAEAIVQTYPMSEVAEIHKLNVSLMPADLQKAMTVQELVDVVEYLTTLRP
jgi:putative membrane-bound dehydrogenase-like protein